VNMRLADPIAVVVRHGATSYTSGLVVRADSPIRAVQDLRDARVAWVDRESASGYLVVRTALRRAGVRTTDAFAHEKFLRNHAAVAKAVLDGSVDIGATCVHVDGDGTLHIARSPFAGDRGLATEQLRIVLEAGPIPSDIFAVRRGTSPRARSALEAALLHAIHGELHRAARTLMYADGFALPTAEHRRMLDALLEEAETRRSVPPVPP
jgi:phosphonate transport system substrate-binding protein